MELEIDAPGEIIGGTLGRVNENNCKLAAVCLLAPLSILSAEIQRASPSWKWQQSAWPRPLESKPAASERIQPSAARIGWPH